MPVPTPESVALLERIFAGLDYGRLGPIYCEEGGDEFWRAHRQPAFDQGLEWARSLGGRLSSGTSLYVGAGVAELPALVTEVVDLGRTVRVATLNGATYLGMEKDLGSIEIGKLADMVVLDRNPLEQIENSDSVSFTMINGVVYEAENMDRVWPSAEPRGSFPF